MSDEPPSPHDTRVLSAIRSMRCEMHELTERQERVTELLDGPILQVGELSSRVDATFVREGFGGVPQPGDTSGDRALSRRGHGPSTIAGDVERSV